LNDNVAGNAAENAHPMSFLLSDDFDLSFPNAGEIREGEVVAHRNNEILIDIGAKSEGIIPNTEVDSMDPDTKSLLAVGNTIPVYIVNPDDNNGNIILSYAKAMEEEDWDNAQNLHETQDIYKGKIIGYNKGGVLIRMGMVRGFVPASQLDNGRRYNSQSNEERLRSLVGEEIIARVIEVDRSRNRLILSERAAAKEIRQEQRKQILGQLA
jgi:small subunit ribosomal protein S1